MSTQAQQPASMSLTYNQCLDVLDYPQDYDDATVAYAAARVASDDLADYDNRHINVIGMQCGCARCRTAG